MSSEEKPLYSVEVKQVEDKLVVNGRFHYSDYEEFDLRSVHDFYVKVLRGKARIKTRGHRDWKEYVVTPLSDRVVLKVEEIFTYCGWEECEETRIVMIYEYTRDCKWHKLSEKVYEE